MNNWIKILTICISMILIGIGLFTMSLLAKNKDEKQEMSEDGKMMYKVTTDIGNKLAKKYSMYPCGIGGGANQKGIWLMALSFDRFGTPLTEDEARKLIINCVDDFLEAVNKDEQIRPFLKNYPFTAKNINLKILNYDKDYNPHYFPSISVIMNTEKDIGFLTEVPSDKYGYHTEKYETYEEAVAILRQEHTEKH